MQKYWQVTSKHTTMSADQRQDTRIDTTWKWRTTLHCHHQNWLIPPLTAFFLLKAVHVLAWSQWLSPQLLLFSSFFWVVPCCSREIHWWDQWLVGCGEYLCRRADYHCHPHRCRSTVSVGAVSVLHIHHRESNLGTQRPKQEGGWHGA